MQVQTLRSVPFTDVLSRLPDEVDREQLLDFFSGWTEYAYGTNSHTLVPWSVLADDLTDCCIELGYGAPPLNEIYPKYVLVTTEDGRWSEHIAGEFHFTDTIFVDLEN